MSGANEAQLEKYLMLEHEKDLVFNKYRVERDAEIARRGLDEAAKKIYVDAHEDLLDCSYQSAVIDKRAGQDVVAIMGTYAKEMRKSVVPYLVNNILPKNYTQVGLNASVIYVQTFADLKNEKLAKLKLSEQLPNFLKMQ